MSWDRLACIVPFQYIASMYLTYVDESGDTGPIVASPTRYFIITAFIVHERDWLNVLDGLVAFRRDLKRRYGLLMNEEIHASVFVSGKPNLRSSASKYQRLLILKDCLYWLANQPAISVITIRCDKQHRAGLPSDIFEYTWRVLIQRIENTLKHRNFPSGFDVNDEKGLILSDNTQGQKVTKLLREMRRYNPIPNMIALGTGSRMIRLRSIIEDPVYRDSAFSYFHQIADVAAYFARQHYEPNRFIRRKGAKNYYTILQPIINRFATYANTWSKVVEI